MKQATAIARQPAIALSAALGVAATTSEALDAALLAAAVCGHSEVVEAAKLLELGL